MPDGCNCKLRTFTSSKSSGVLTTASGSIQTNGWPHKYLKNVDYEWIIKLPDCSKRINITFIAPFGLAGNPPCTRNYVEFFDGTDSSAPSLGRYYSCCDPPPSFTTPCCVMKVIFHAGPVHGPRRRGFRIDYESVLTPTPTTISPITTTNIAHSTPPSTSPTPVPIGE